MFCTFLCLISQQSCEAAVQLNEGCKQREETGRLCDNEFVFSLLMFLCTTSA